MSDNTEVVIKQVSQRKFLLHRRDVDVEDPSYIGYYVGEALSIKEATRIADMECAEYGYTIEWLGE